MKSIDISITKARLKNFRIMIGNEDKLDIEATISLMNEGEKEITSYHVCTLWEPKIEFPPTISKEVAKIVTELEKVVVRQCNKELNLLEN
jgi:hypothetical protein